MQRSVRAVAALGTAGSFATAEHPLGFRLATVRRVIGAGLSAIAERTSLETFSKCRALVIMMY